MDLVLMHGDDALDVVRKYGDDGIDLLRKHGDDALDTVRKHGDDAVDAIKKYGDDAAEGFKNGKTPEEIEGSTGSDLDGIRIINKKYVGKTYELSGDLAQKYPKGVNFSNEGFPEFEPYSIKKVNVNNLEGDEEELHLLEKE